METLQYTDEREDLAALLLGTARGRQADFAALYRTTGPRLLAVILRIVRRRDLAEDILQEVFVRIWREAGGYQADKGSPMAWMTTIARNRAIDSWRRADRQRRNQAAQEAQAEIDETVVPMNWDGAGDEARALQHCLGALDEPQRNAVVLAYVEGLTHQELSDRLSCPLGTIKSWLRRSLWRLKECLGDG